MFMSFAFYLNETDKKSFILGETWWYSYDIKNIF